MSSRPTKAEAKVLIGAQSLPAGQVTFVNDGRREYSAFRYHPACLARRAH